MLAAAPDPDDVDRRFVVSPNHSLSWQGNCLFIALVGLVLFLVASGFVLAGLWVVAPFAGLELLAVGIALYAVHRRGRRLPDRGAVPRIKKSKSRSTTNYLKVCLGGGEL